LSLVVCIGAAASVDSVAIGADALGSGGSELAASFLVEGKLEFSLHGSEPVTTGDALEEAEAAADDEEKNDSIFFCFGPDFLTAAPATGLVPKKESNELCVFRGSGVMTLLEASFRYRLTAKIHLALSMLHLAIEELGQWFESSCHDAIADTVE
jgi:hypothetical protein